MSTANLPIRIAGAGPSGLAAAITLDKASYHAEVIERTEDVSLVWWRRNIFLKY